MKILYVFFGLLIVAQNASQACQYGMDAGTQAHTALMQAHPDAHQIKVLRDLQDVTLLSFSNDCPKDFRLAEKVSFVENGSVCFAKIVLIYRDHSFYKSALRAQSCKALNES